MTLYCIVAYSVLSLFPRLLDRFYSADATVSETLSDDMKHSPLRLSQTLPVLLFWCLFNIPLLVTSAGRSFYWQASVFCTVIGWIYMLLCT